MDIITHIFTAIQNVIHIFTAIPNVIWIVVIASCLTIFVVMWTNRGYARRQHELLAQEERKFKFERNLQLKKEVYIEMVAVFSRSHDTFLKLIHLEISLEEIKDNTRNMDEAAAKALLIANEHTVTKLQEYTADFLEAYLALLKKRNRLIQLSKTINAYNDLIANANTEKDRLLKLLDDAVNRNINDNNSMEHIQNNYKSQEETIVDAGNKIDEKRKEFQPLYKDFINQCLVEYARLRVAMIPMIAAIRNELDSEIHYEVFEYIMQKSMSRITNAVNKMILEEKKYSALRNQRPQVKERVNGV